MNEGYAKFRGKTVMPERALEEIGMEDEDWSYGSLIPSDRSPYIVGNVVEASEDGILFEFWLPVHPESVAQYTRLNDKFGTEIYYGDILYDAYYGVTGVVTYNEGRYNFDWGNISEPLSECNDDCEVIGNMYENSALLREEGYPNE